MAPSCSEHPYRLVQEIRHDSGGTIFKAYHTALRRTETLRILPNPRSDDELFVSRLRETALAMAMLAHPHVAPVYGYGRLEDGRYYLALEYLEGDSLGTLIDEGGALSEGLTRRLLYQLASAMAYVHESGLVHRHLCPSSIMLVDQDGVAPNLKVRDFGLAAILESTDQVVSALPNAGTLYGSPAYIAPERAAGGNANPHEDIFSFGCVAHTIMTGQPPIAGMPFSSVERKSLNPELVGVVLRCLERDPSARYANGTALCGALQALTGFHGEPTWPQGFGDAPPTTIRENAKTIRRERFPQVKTELDDAGGLPTGPAEEPENTFQRLEELMTTADGIRNAGPQLLACLAKLRGVADALEEQERAREQLHSLGQAADRNFRRKEALLRFELGELSIQLGGNRSAQERAQMELNLNELTEELVRMEHLHARELQAVTNREVDLAATRHELEETSRELCNTLAALVALSEDE